MMRKKSDSEDAFMIERHGDLTVISANPALELMDYDLEEQVADLILTPLRRQANPQIIFDLSRVDHFGSMFLALLIRCWKLATSKGGSMTLCGLSAQARELLRVTSLDMVWPIYDNRLEATEALELD
jgi:anti-anti-sigma factor